MRTEPFISVLFSILGAVVLIMLCLAEVVQLPVLCWLLLIGAILCHVVISSQEYSYCKLTTEKRE